MRAAVMCLAGLMVAAPSISSGAEEELMLAAEPSVDMISRARQAEIGVGGGLTAWFGLDDVLWLFASAGAFASPSEPEAPYSPTRWEGFGGLAAAFDVFRVVPHVELGLGVVGSAGRLFPTVRLGAGADYLLTPDWSVGAAIRYRPLVEEEIGSAAVTGVLRIGYRLAW